MIIFSWLLVIFGLLIRAISIYQMNGNNVWKICAPMNIQMNGIYKYIRHPMYIGGMMMYVGLIFISTKSNISILLNLCLASSPFVLPRTFNLVGIFPGLIILFLGGIICK